MSIVPVDQYVYEVWGRDRFKIVNIKEKTCIYRKFNLEQFLCTHALAVMRQLKLHTPNYKIRCTQWTLSVLLMKRPFILLVIKQTGSFQKSYQV